jgi:hypothetical protein
MMALVPRILWTPMVMIYDHSHMSVALIISHIIHRSPLIMQRLKIVTILKRALILIIVLAVWGSMINPTASSINNTPKKNTKN